MPPIIATSVSWTEKIKPLATKLETTCQVEEAEIEVEVHATVPPLRRATARRRSFVPPIMPGTRTRFSMTSAIRLMTKAETKYSAVTAR